MIWYINPFHLPGFNLNWTVLFICARHAERDNWDAQRPVASAFAPR